MPFYRFICYNLFRWYTGIQCYLGEAHITFDVGVRDIKEAPTSGKSQEMQVCMIVFGVFRICDWWQRAQQIFFQDRDHYEVDSAY